MIRDLYEFIQICDSDIIFWSMNVFSLTYFVRSFLSLSPLFRRKRVLRSTVCFEKGILFLARSLMSFALNMEDEDIFVFDDSITTRSPFDFPRWIKHRLYQLHEN